LHQRNFATSVAGPTTEQAEVTAAIDRLEDEVARLALQMKLTARIAVAAEVEPAAEALRAATGSIAERSASQLQPDPAQCDRPETFGPQHSIAPKSATEDLRVADLGPASTEAKLASPEVAIRTGESAIAAGILNLHERLGSFIKS
jgi:hypothetical protein